MSFSLRFIVDTSHSAAFNMAADLFLMEQCTAESAVCVRFYSWQPPAVTIGRMQHAGNQLDCTALERDGVSWIRRPTGGRAVLHCEDLTYSCIFPRTNTEMGGSVAATYAAITRCLARGLKEADIETTLQDSVSPLIRSGREIKLPCFLAPNRHEIMVRGRKLIGSAQYRSASAVLQHGSLPLSKAYRRLPKYLPVSKEEQCRQMALLAEKSISLEEIDSTISSPQLIAAFKNGFAATLDCRPYEEVWREEELKGIERMLQDSKFQERCRADHPAPCSVE